MSTSAPALGSALAAALDALAAVPTDLAAYRAPDDSNLLELNRLAARERQLADTHLALIAGEIARRSNRALGDSGLAQRNGFRTPEELVRSFSRSTARDASTAVRVGLLVQDAAAIPDVVTGELLIPTRPWLAEVACALQAGALGTAAAESIARGLGEPTDAVTPVALADAAAQLCTEAVVLDADRLFRRARELRDELDDAGIIDREQERRERRSLRFSRLPDGMGRLVWLLDPESSAIASELYDRATSPRRGGPRFVGACEIAQSIADDPRTTEQLASDVFLELIRQGADADGSRLLGTGAPTLHVLVTESSLRSLAGHGRIEGLADPISIESVERIACSALIVPIAFDEHGAVLALGRERRLFSRRQREALAARDGGCMFPGCERPPSWCEAHHIDPWKSGGRTDVAVGILLCRHHHLLLHNNHWQITRDASGFWLTAPSNIDPTETPQRLPSKSAALRDLLRTRAG